MESRVKLLGHPVHSMLIVLPLGLFISAVVMDGLAVWLSRRDTPDMLPTATLFALEGVALLLGAVAGWLGGELVDRLAVGVDDGAHLNAPSSLSGRPAR
jgi:uncharacterized membrane protein